jgi:OOP family OmpA-OmpF porin
MDVGSKGEFDALLGGVSATSDLDDTGDAWGVQVGYRWGKYVGMEIGYQRYGQADYVAELTATPQDYSVRFIADGISASALGYFPLGDHFDLQGRAGVLWSDVRVRERLEDVTTGDFMSVEAKDSSVEFFAGIGAAWNITPSFAVRVEYQKVLDMGDEDSTGEFDVDLVTFGILFR